MDESIGDVFLRDVLPLEGIAPNEIRESVRQHLAVYERQAWNAEPNKHMKDQATHACRALCRNRVVEEIARHRGTPTADHLKIVLSVIDGPARFPLKDD